MAGLVVVESKVLLGGWNDLVSLINIKIAVGVGLLFKLIDIVLASSVLGNSYIGIR